MSNRSKNTKLSKAKTAKNDEFYTQYSDIEKEIQAYLEFNHDVFRDKTVLLPCDDPEWSNFTRYFVQNFKQLGLKKLISTSFAPKNKIEKNSPTHDETKFVRRGKIFTLTKGINADDVIDSDDLAWTYLTGDGDFRSDEVKALRDEADIIVTNPPFSLFRQFLAWIVKAEKSFIVVANKNCLTYKEVFPLIKENKLWSGRTEWSGGMWFKTVDETDIDKVIDGVNMKNVSSIWLTNLDHGRRHEPLRLMTMADNLKFNKKLDGKNAYIEYDNYKAIEVPFTNAIPSDYAGIMAVPISFLDKYNPEQFEILGIDTDVKDGKLNDLIKESWTGKLDRGYIDNKRIYSRILVKVRN